jgi:hypothetical protein
MRSNQSCFKQDAIQISSKRTYFSATTQKNNPKKTGQRPLAYINKVAVK